MPSVPLDTKRLMAIASTSASSRSTSTWRSSSSITSRSRSSSISAELATRCRRSPRRPRWRARGRRRSHGGPLGGIVVGLRRDAGQRIGEAATISVATASRHVSTPGAYQNVDATGRCSSRYGHFQPIVRAGTQPAVTFQTLPDRRARTRRCRVRPWRSPHHRHVVPPSRARTSLARPRRQRKREDHAAADRRRCTSTPRRGTVEVLGERLGRTDVRTLRRRIGYASSALAAQLRADAERRRRRQDREVRRARAVVAPLRRRRCRAGDRVPGPDGCGRLRRTHVRHAVVGRATTRPPGAHVDERPGGGAPRRAGGPPRHRGPRAAGRCARRHSPRIQRHRRSCSSRTTSTRFPRG